MLTKADVPRYSICMATSRFLLCMTCTLLLSPALLQAEDNVLPPPTVSETARPVADRAETVTESAPNLHEELNPSDDSTADVRSYKRKDGATITEYAISGRVYKVKVEPAGGLPAYYLYRNKEGQFERRLPGGKKALNPPSWILGEF